MTSEHTFLPNAPVRDGRIRVVIDTVLPAVDGGRFAVKRVAGDSLRVTAHCFTDGHDVLRVMLRWRRDDQAELREVSMRPSGNDEWCAEFALTSLGRYIYTVTAWVDSFESWRYEMARRIDGADIRIAAQVGVQEITAASPITDTKALKALALDEPFAALAARYPDRRLAAHYPIELPLMPALWAPEDFQQLVVQAATFGIEIALDIAFQCAPDHPYVKAHPDWFRWRPDGSVQYAENPPKKYQDIYPFNFECEDWCGLWTELNSEKYQLHHWTHDDPTSLAPFIARVNQIRRDNPALQADHSLRFLPIDNDQLLAYAKTSDEGDNVVVTVVNLDPQNVQWA